MGEHHEGREHHEGHLHINVTTGDLLNAMAPQDQERFQQLGRVNYEAYCTALGGVSGVTGAPLPAWDDQSEHIRQGWIGGALAVTAQFVA